VKQARFHECGFLIQLCFATESLFLCACGNPRTRETIARRSSLCATVTRMKWRALRLDKQQSGASQTTQRENWFADGSTSEAAVKNSSCEKERVRLVVSHVKCGGTTSQQLAGSLFAVAIGFVNPVAVIRNYTPQIRWDKKIGRAVAYRRLQLCVQTRQLCFVDHQTAQYKK